MGSCSLGKKMKDYGFSPKETKKKGKSYIICKRLALALSTLPATFH